MRDAEIHFILHGSFKNYNTNIMNFSDFDKRPNFITKIYAA